MIAFLTLAVTEGGHGAEEEGGSFLVEPGLGLMVWTLLVFLAAMALLWKLAFPKISEALDKRQKAIEESIDVAEKTKVEASAPWAPASASASSSARSSSR